MASAHDSLLAQAFADQCRRWAVQLGADARGIQAAGAAGLAVAAAAAEGHVCLPLVPGADALDLEGLQGSGLAGPPGSDRPLVLDGQVRLYLARHFAAERQLAAALLALHRRPVPAPGAAARQMLQQLFPPSPEVDGQKLAVALALCRALTVISGGPGTGKTTTVARLLACLLADDPGCRIALAAPTGKAAARLQESLLARAGEWPAALAERLPRQASTLHRLLGLGPEGEAPRHHQDNPLPVDVLVVDEASMLDLGLALQVLQALPPQGRLVLLGDKNQLKAVEAGAVFAVLSDSAALTAATRAQLAELTGWPPAGLADLPGNEAPSPLADAVVWLTHSHRFAGDSALGRLAAALVRGEGALALACLQEGGDLLHLEGEAKGLGPAELNVLLQGYAPYRQALAAWAAGERDPAPVFAAFERYRVLCATRQGARGVQGVNERLAQALRPPGRSPLLPGPFPGQALMILRNDPATRLFNGDIGIALEDGEGLGVWFPEGHGGFRRLAPGRLPAWETAFALTVHKSQGSEFARVALVLPERDSPLLTRELVYTGVTRARQGVQLLGSGALLLQAAARPIRREGGLAERLQED